MEYQYKLVKREKSYFFTTLLIEVSNKNVDIFIKTEEIIEKVLKDYSINKANVVSITKDTLKNIMIGIKYVNINLSLFNLSVNTEEKITKILTSEPLNFSIKNIYSTPLYATNFSKRTPIIWHIEIEENPLNTSNIFSRRCWEIELSTELGKRLNIYLDIYS